LEYIDASDMSFFPCRIRPVVSPAHNAPGTKAKYLFDLDLGMGRLEYEVPPKLSYDFLTRVHGAVGGWTGVFKDTIVTHKLHHPRDIMPIEGFIELKNDAHRRFYP
jgi:hypothetical protein